LPPPGTSKTSLLTSEPRIRILALHAEAKGSVEIGRLFDLPPKAVARVIAEAQTADDKPIPCPRRPTRKETFPCQPGESA
jgi:hypothetical protein